MNTATASTRSTFNVSLHISDSRSDGSTNSVYYSSSNHNLDDAQKQLLAWIVSLNGCFEVSGFIDNALDVVELSHL